MNLVTLATVKAFLEKTDLTHDALLNSIITQYSKRAEKFCNRLFEKVARTRPYNAGRKDIFLPAYPIDLTAALTVVLDDSTLTVNDDYYVYEDSGWIEFFSTPSYIKPKQLSITWTGGYASDGVPDDLQYALMKQIVFVFRRRKDVGVSSVSLPDGSLSVSFPDDLLPEVKQILKSYRRTPGPI